MTFKIQTKINKRRKKKKKRLLPIKAKRKIELPLCSLAFWRKDVLFKLSLFQDSGTLSSSFNIFPYYYPNPIDKLSIPISSQKALLLSQITPTHKSQYRTHPSQFSM